MVKKAHSALFRFLRYTQSLGRGYYKIAPSQPYAEAAEKQKPPKIPESVLVVIHTPELDVLIIERVDHKGFWVIGDGLEGSHR